MKALRNICQSDTIHVILFYVGKDFSDSLVFGEVRGSGYRLMRKMFCKQSPHNLHSYGVQIGAESGDNEILKKIGKNVTTDTIERAVRIFLKHGITVVCSFILGHPDDTAETCEKTIRFGKYLKTISGGYTSCKFAILTPLPGTPVYERKDDLGIKLLTENWDNYTFFDTVMETKNLNRRQLQNLYMKAWATYAS